MRQDIKLILELLKSQNSGIPCWLQKILLVWSISVQCLSTCIQLSPISTRNIYSGVIHGLLFRH